MERPLDYDNQDDEIKFQFNQLESAIDSIHEDWSLAECMALNEHIQREVTAKPILARIMKRPAHSRGTFPPFGRLFQPWW